VAYNNNYTIVECPRDAMQGWSDFIATEKKIEYLNALLSVGFHTLDFGSFVSPKAIPQMADTKEVLAGLDLSNTNTKLLAIVANHRGAQDAMNLEAITYIGFPFSISPTFQQRNTNSTIEASLVFVAQLQQMCVLHNKQLVIYLSMAFGNPYGDAYNETILLNYAKAISDLGVKIISLADTVGVATPTQIKDALNKLIPSYNDVLFGVHLHTNATNWQQKLKAAIDAGCTRIDGALMGIGGCPMAKDDLVGNLDTLNILNYFESNNIKIEINKNALNNAIQMATSIFETKK
jgi:hydroxymethylglutaryl-CoA lyase